MKLIDQLRRAKSLHATCPSCGEDFRLADAIMFHVKDPLPPEAMVILKRRREELKDRRAELAAAKKRMTTTATATTKSVNIGKIVEKIAPSFPGFAYSPRDCRALFEPIDYLVFAGLEKTGAVDVLHLVDVKSGKARLTPDEKSIKDAAEGGGVEFKRLPAPKRR